MTAQDSLLSRCESADVGADLEMGAFVHVSRTARVGAGVRLGDHVRVSDDVQVGDRCTIGPGAQLGSGTRIESDCVLGASVTCGGPDDVDKIVVIRERARVGSGAVICGGVTIGRGARVEPGSVVTRSVPANAIVEGHPARISGYTTSDQRPAPNAAAPSEAGSRELAVGGASIHRLRSVRDLRGELSVGEFERELPFLPHRYFLVYDVPSVEARGEHAHRECHQFLICVRGAISVALDDGVVREEVRLDHPSLGVHIPPMVWALQYKHTPDAVLLVFASHHYDGSDYIRDHDSFLKLAKR